MGGTIWGRHFHQGTVGWNSIFVPPWFASKFLVQTLIYLGQNSSEPSSTCQSCQICHQMSMKLTVSTFRSTKMTWNSLNWTKLMNLRQNWSTPCSEIFRNFETVSFILIWWQIWQLWLVEEGSELFWPRYIKVWTRDFEANHGGTKIEFQPTVLLCEVSLMNLQEF